MKTYFSRLARRTGLVKEPVRPHRGPSPISAPPVSNAGFMEDHITIDASQNNLPGEIFIQGSTSRPEPPESGATRLESTELSANFHRSYPDVSGSKSPRESDAVVAKGEIKNTKKDLPESSSSPIAPLEKSEFIETGPVTASIEKNTEGGWIRARVESSNSFKPAASSQDKKSSKPGWGTLGQIDMENQFSEAGAEFNILPVNEKVLSVFERGNVPLESGSESPDETEPKSVLQEFVHVEEYASPKFKTGHQAEFVSKHTPVAKEERGKAGNPQPRVDVRIGKVTVDVRQDPLVAVAGPEPPPPSNRSLREDKSSFSKGNLRRHYLRGY